MNFSKFEKLLSIFIVVFLLVVQLSLHVNAANTSGDIFLIGDSMYSDISQNKSGNGWSWNAAKFTLTLNGYNGGPVIFLPYAQNTKTLHIVVKNKNVLHYSSVPTHVQFQKRTVFAALLVEKCNVHVSGGGTLSTNASGENSTSSLWVSKDLTIEDITLNCIGEHQSIVSENIVVNDSVLNIDSPEGYWCTSSLFENSTINFKNSYRSQIENFASGGKHTFKNCTIDALVGARPLNSTPIRATLFSGMANYVFDHTAFKVRQGQHNRADNVITLFSLGYPDNIGNSIAINNNSRFELTDCVDNAFRAFTINISNSSITGTCTDNLFSSILLNITDSSVDITCVGNKSSGNALIVGQDINIANSNIKGQSNGNIWGTGILSYSEYENNISLTDTYLDLEGKGNTFGGGFSWNYKMPEKWTVILDGVESNLSANSAKLNLFHDKVVVKFQGNATSTQPGNGISSTKPANQSVSEKTTDKEPTKGSASEQTADKELKETETSGQSLQKTDRSGKKEKNSQFTPFAIIISILGVLGAITYIYIRLKNKKQL